MICGLSRQYFTSIYQRLDITLEEFGESFYNPYIPAMLEDFYALDLIKEDDTVTKKGFKVDKDKKKGKGGKDKKVEEEKPVEEETPVEQEE